MGDDPYDFEIAIPSHRADKSSRYTAQSDEGEDDSEEELDDSGESDSPKRKPQQEHPKRSTTATHASSSALDKAKSFLSKYSAKSVTAGGASSERSSSRRRIELSMEDSNDNFMNDSDDDTDNSLGKRSKRETKLVKAINSEDESDDNDEDYRTKPAVSSTPTHNTQSPQETNCSEDEDASASFANGSDEGPPPSFNAPVVEYQQPVAATNIRAASTWQNPLQSTAKKNSSSGSSIASQSDEFDQSIEGEEASLSVSEAKRPSMVILSDPAPAFGEASASGVCEEEVFDEEAVAIEPISTLQSKFQADPAPADSTNIEPNFDYSMDFSDDEVEAKEPIATVQSPIALSHHSEDASKSQSFDGKSGGKNEQSEYFESDDGSQLHEGEIQIVSEEQEMPSRKNSLGDEMPEDAGKLVSMAKHEQELEQMMPPEQCYSSRAANTTTTTDLEATDKDTSPVLLSSARQRVVIIREYDRVESEKPEMKDVSTQFTGNHAGIQAELVPEGMHNLFPRCSIQQEQPHLEPMSVPESTKRPTDPTSSSSFPPPPPQMKPPSPSAGNYEYSMGQIHSPSTSSSTSVYKQQLIELQRQIQLKKQETEKLVRDRMAFQYSTFRGTERFIDINRPPRMQLWEALMRVDPMLDEAKAREIARLTGSHTGA